MLPEIKSIMIKKKNKTKTKHEENETRISIPHVPLKIEIFFSYWDKERKCYFFREKMAHQNL